MGWPWTDEALAVALIDRIHGVPHERAQFRLDISFGPPPPYRREVLARMLDVLGAGSLQFGSDCFLPCSGAHVRERKQWVLDLMDELDLGADTRERLWSGTAAAWLGLPATAGTHAGAHASTHAGSNSDRPHAGLLAGTGGGGGGGGDYAPRPWRPVCC